MMKFVVVNAMCLLAALCLLGTPPNASAIEPFCQEFCEMPDPNDGWVIVGNPPEILPTCQAVFFSDKAFVASGLQKVIGPGDFELTMEWDDLSLNGNSDNQTRIVDGSTIFIIQNLYLGGTLQIAAVIIGGTGPYVAAADLGDDTESLKMRITWQDDPDQTGGVWRVEYEKNNGGYAFLGQSPADLVPDAAADRLFRFTFIPIAGGAHVAVAADRICLNALDKAFGPLPLDGAVDVDPDTDISWQTITGTVSSDVYWGTELSCVQNGNATDPAYASCYLGRFPANEIELPQLDLMQDYYWRVDCVDDGGAITPGAVWTYTSLNNYRENVCVEEFESYADNTTFQAVWGAYDGDTQAIDPNANVTLATAEARNGAQSMQITVDNSTGGTPAVAASRLLDPTLDGTPYDSLIAYVKATGSTPADVALTVTGPLEEALAQGTVTVTPGDDWIPVTATFNPAYAGLSQAGRVSVSVIGVPEGEDIIVYCDDICLRYNCSSAVNISASDADRDCQTDIVDFSAFAGSYLGCSYLNAAHCND